MVQYGSLWPLLHISPSLFTALWITMPGHAKRYECHTNNVNCICSYDRSAIEGERRWMVERLGSFVLLDLLLPLYRNLLLLFGVVECLANSVCCICIIFRHIQSICRSIFTTLAAFFTCISTKSNRILQEFQYDLPS